MVNFTNNNRALAEDVHNMFAQIGFKASFMAVRVPTGYKYTTRVATRARELIKELGLYKT